VCVKNYRHGCGAKLDVMSDDFGKEKSRNRLKSYINLPHIPVRLSA
jgi:hypothetical protein